MIVLTHHWIQHPLLQCPHPLRFGTTPRRFHVKYHFHTLHIIPYFAVFSHVWFVLLSSYHFCATSSI